MTDWHHILAPTDTVDELADDFGRAIQFSEKPPGRLARIIHSAVLFMTIIERSRLFRFAAWMFVIASLLGVAIGSNRAAWAAAALTGMLVLVTQSMTNATRHMAEISHDASERERFRSMVKWQAHQDPEDSRAVILTNVSLTNALDVHVIYDDANVVGARASVENVGAGMNTKFRLSHDSDFEEYHFLKVFWKDMWHIRDHDMASATIHVIPSNGVALRYPLGSPHQ